jgi:hypothetical protein
MGLWEHYRSTLHSRENLFNKTGDEFILEAVQLARQGLASADRGFDLNTPPTALQRRLISGNVINQIAGRRYQFSHEKLQDYLYAWYACENNFLFEEIHGEIGELHQRNVMLWIRDIYQTRNAPLYERFLEEALNG